MTTITDCDPRIVAKFDQVRKLSGLRAPNSAMVAAQTSSSARRSNQSPQIWRARAPSPAARVLIIVLNAVVRRFFSFNLVARLGDCRLADLRADKLLRHTAAVEDQHAV